MRLSSFSSLVVATSLYAGCSDPSTAVTRQPTPTPLPEVSQISASAMRVAFLDVPVECRRAVQRVLAQYGMYLGAADGAWSAGISRGIVAYVRSTGNLAHGWQSVPGSKGILWNISQSDLSCPEATF
jgi:hypothetical protein